MFTDPIKNLKALRLREEHVVADLGAGTGFYTILAAGLATKGKVYAIEIAKDLLETIHRKATDEGLENVEVLWGNAEKAHGTQLADGVVDVVIASNVLFQINDKDQFIEEAKRILKPSGRMLVVDWSPASHVRVPERMLWPKHQALEAFLSRGFVLDSHINTGAHHYGMILKRL